MTGWRLDDLVDAARQRGLFTFDEAVAWVHARPYGRVARPVDVFVQGRGTCSTKHAALAWLARALGRTDIQLLLGFFEMSAVTHPVLEEVLGDRAVLEAHMVLRVDGGLLDVTFPGETASVALRDLQVVDPADLADKTRRHRQALDAWCMSRGRDPDATWALRERAIARLSA